MDNQCTNYQTIGTTVDGAFAPYLRAGPGPLQDRRRRTSTDRRRALRAAVVRGRLGKRAPFAAGDNVAIIGGGPMGCSLRWSTEAVGAGRSSWWIWPVPVGVRPRDRRGPRRSTPDDVDVPAAVRVDRPRCGCGGGRGGQPGE
ncbi:MAG: hypothetical protein R2854_06805 [Caldilineaceae bacterium]